MLKNEENGYFYIKNVLKWLISRVFGNFTVTFVNGPRFRDKKQPKPKSCSRKKNKILKLCCRAFFLRIVSRIRKNTDFANFRPLVPFSHFFAVFPRNDPHTNFKLYGVWVFFSKFPCLKRLNIDSPGIKPSIFRVLVGYVNHCTIFKYPDRLRTKRAVKMSCMKNISTSSHC
jgi:hypothetical protein